MNRREVLSAMTAMCGAIGVPARSDVIEGELKATLAIIHLERPVPKAGIDALHESWKRVQEKFPSMPPCIVMENGIRLEFTEQE